MEHMEFYRAMKAHCKTMNGQCENCCMRLYCYTPPCEQTDYLNETVISLLTSSHTHTESCDRSSHCTSGHQMPCPCNLDMSTAPGCEPR